MTELQRLARRLADDYQFECHGGPLRNCQEWRALCEAIDSLAVDPPPRGASPQAETGEASVVAAIARHRMNHSDAWSTGFVAALGCCADDLPDEIVAIRPNRADLPDAKAYRRVYRRGFIEALARAAALVEAAVERTIAEFKQTCEWRYNADAEWWQSGCDSQDLSGDERLVGPDEKAKFCPYCGKPLRLVPAKEQP